MTMDKDLQEDVYTSEYKIKKWIDPQTGEEKHRKVRPHRVEFAASKMHGDPAQDTEKHKRKKSLVKFTSGEDDGQKGVSEMKSFAKFAEEIVQADTSDRMGDMVDRKMKDKGIDPRAVKYKRSRQVVDDDRRGTTTSVDDLRKENMDYTLDEMSVEPAPHGIKVGDKVQIAKNQWGGPSGGYHDEKHTVTRVTPTHISIKTKHGIEDHHKYYVKKVNEEVHMTFADAASSYNGMETPQVVTVVQHPTASNKYAVAVADPRKNEMDKVTMYKYVSTHDTEDAASKAAQEFAKMNKIPHVDNIEEAKKDDVPFDPPFKKFRAWTKDKSGAKHTAKSRARHLARMALKKQMKEELGLDVPDSVLDLMEADDLHPAAGTLLKHIKPEHHGVYKPYLKKGVFNGSYKDRSDVLKAAHDAGHLREDIDEALDTTATHHDVTKTKTGRVYTKQYDGDEGEAKKSGYEIAKEREGQKRGRGRPTKDPSKLAQKAYGGAQELQRYIVGSVPKKSKELEKLGKTKHKMGEAIEFLASLEEEQFDRILNYIGEEAVDVILQELNNEDQGE